MSGEDIVELPCDCCDKPCRAFWYGYSNQTGYGRVTRNSVSALCGLGLKIKWTPFMDGACGYELTRFVPSALKNAVRVANLMPNRHVPQGRYNIRYTVWEASRIPPDWVELLNNEDEVWVPCLPPTEIILTKDGLKEIKDIEVGDLVFTSTGSFKKVLGIQKRYFSGNLTSLKRHGAPNLLLTSEHRVFASKKKYRPSLINERFEFSPKVAKDLTELDYLFFPRLVETRDVIINSAEILSDKYCLKDEMLVKTYTEKIRSKLINQVRKTHIPMKLPIDKQLASLIGYFVTEGWAGTDEISFTLNISEKDIAEEITSIMKEIFSANSHIRYRNNSMEVRFCNRALALLFRRLFYNSKKEKSLLPEILFSRKEVLLVLAKAMLKGDGSPLKKGWQYDTNSPELAGHFLLLLNKLGIMGSIHKIKGGFSTFGANKTKKYQYKEHWRVIATGKASEILVEPSQLGSSRTFQRYKIEEDKFIFRVQGKSLVKYEGEVYDLSVEEDESFVCINTTVHNSHFCKQVFEDSGVTKPIYVIPHGVDVNEFNPNSKNPLYPDKRFTFLWIGDNMPRKGLDVFLKAFKQEFRRNEPVRALVRLYYVGVITGDGPARTMTVSLLSPERLQKAQNKLTTEVKSENFWTNAYLKEGIQIVTEPIPSSEMPRLYRSAQCYVLCSRGEGYGLCGLEALASGLPVIYTNWGGQTEFLNENNAYPVKCKLVPVRDMPAEYEPLLGKAKWAEPVQADLQRAMRQVYENYETALEKAKNGVKLVQNNYTWAHIAQRMKARLECNFT